MSNYQSSSHIVGPLTTDDGVLARGKVTISTTPAGTGHYGSAVVDLEHISAIVSSPTIEVYEFPEPQAPGYQEVIVQCPRSDVDLPNGHLSFVSYAQLDKGAKSDAELLLTIFFWSRDHSYPRDFYYLVKRTPISNEDIFTP